MSKKAIFALVAAASMLPAPAYGREKGNADSHIWRGEYAKAAAGTHDATGSRKAAYLTMAGEMEAASRILSREEDSLWTALVSFKAGQWERVVDMTCGGKGNALLDLHRLAVRSRSLLQMGDTLGACSVISEISSLKDSDPAVRRHHLYAEMVNLQAPLLVSRGGGYERFQRLYGDIELLSGRNLILLSRESFTEGDMKRAGELLKASLQAGGEALCPDMIDGLVSGMLAAGGVLTDDEWKQVLLELGSEGCGAPGEILEYLAERGISPHEEQFLRGVVLGGKGELRRAGAIYKRVFSSGASIDLKKDALYRLASIDYRLGHHARASENYRLFGMYYPADKRAERALDTAARIMVSKGKWSKAVDIWEQIRKRGPRSSAGKAALLSEAVLLHRMGNNAGAARILAELRHSAGSGLEPAVLYWLYRTSPSEDKRSGISRRIKRDYPLSIYTKAMEEGASLFVLGEGFVEDPAVLAGMEKAEYSSFSRAEDILGSSRPAAQDHEAWSAFEYFMERGLVDEAEACGRVIVTLFGDDRESMWHLYSLSRRNGIIGLSTWIMNRKYYRPPGGLDTARLRFPVAYSGLVAENVSKRNLRADLLLSVMREESAFDRKAVSRAGALGLMQIMPSTGEWIGRKLGRRGVEEGILLDPNFNIEAGSWYLRFLLERNGSSIVGALASYNAGNAKMSSWRKHFPPAEDPLMALEMIGIRETREYVRRVLDSMVAYGSLSKVEAEDR